MIRFALFCCVILGAVSSVGANLPLHVGQSDGKQPVAGPDERGKIIDDLKTDFQDVLDRFNKDDPGAKTRAKQKRIIEGLDKLLDQPDDPRSQNQPSPPSPSSEPKQNERQPPGSKTKAPEPTAPSVPAVRERAQQTRPAESATEVQKAIAEHGPWQLPPRARPDVDALVRERFVPRYEELLRAYYRSIAGSGRHKDE